MRYEILQKHLKFVRSFVPIIFQNKRKLFEKSTNSFQAKKNRLLNLLLDNYFFASSLKVVFYYFIKDFSKFFTKLSFLTFIFVILRSIEILIGSTFWLEKYVLHAYL